MFGYICYDSCSHCLPLCVRVGSVISSLIWVKFLAFLFSSLYFFPSFPVELLHVLIFVFLFY